MTSSFTERGCARGLLLGGGLGGMLLTNKLMDCPTEPFKLEPAFEGSSMQRMGMRSADKSGASDAEKARCGAEWAEFRPYYNANGITLFHGDVRKWLPVVAGAFNALVTDPPYPNNAGHFDADVPLARAVIMACDAPEALIFWSELEKPPCALPHVAMHVWHRNNVNGRPYEPVYHYAADGKKRRSSVLAHPAVFGGVGPGCREYLGHPTQKPVALMQALLALTSGTVLDPFAGVGATLHAAKNLGRCAIGIEREERYCEQIALRLAQDVLSLGGGGAEQVGDEQGESQSRASSHTEKLTDAGPKTL